MHKLDVQFQSYDASNRAKMKFRICLGLRTVIDISKRRKRGSKKSDPEKTAELIDIQ